jgi:D-beta-D-heptose 7-phosphate kinase/D-beta-D-heptose 1-phosphate adenosyltransferase
VNGTFDIVHRGHIEMLNYAKSLGSQLLVAIDTDRRVRELKGNSRPVNSEEDRRFLLLNLKSVDWVWTFDSDQDLIKIINTYRPDIMVKGSDYQGQPILGQDLIKDIKFYDRVEPYSTTNTIQRIADR